MTKKTKKKRPTKVRHRDATAKNSATVDIGGRAARLTSQHKLELARRRARVAELAGEGKSVRDCEELLRSEGFTHCDHATVAKDLKLERDRLTQATQATTAQHRQRVLAKLTLLEDRVRARGYDDPNYVGDLLNILDRLIKLLGLSQERHQVNVAVGVEQDPELPQVRPRNAMDSGGSLRAAVGTVSEIVATADGGDHRSDRAARRQPSMARQGG